MGKYTRWNEPACAVFADGPANVLAWEYAREIGPRAAAALLDLSSKRIASVIRKREHGIVAAGRHTGRCHVAWDGPASAYFPGAADGLAVWEYVAERDVAEMALALGIIPEAVKIALRRRMLGQVTKPRTGTEMVAVSCSYCDKPLEMPRYRLKYNKTGRFYCGHTCRSKHYTQMSSVERPCAACGKPVHVKAHIAAKYERSFCNHACRYEYIQGPANPRWLGGNMHDERKEWMKWGGRQWIQQCLLRDKRTCRLCGHEQEPGERLEVHHKLAFAEFKHFRSTPDNGMTVCMSCHAYLHSNAGELVRYRLEVDALAELTAGLRTLRPAMRSA